MKLQAIDLPVSKPQTRRKTTPMIAPVIALALVLLIIFPIYYPLLKNKYPPMISSESSHLYIQNSIKPAVPDSLSGHQLPPEKSFAREVQTPPTPNNDPDLVRTPGPISRKAARQRRSNRGRRKRNVKKLPAVPVSGDLVAAQKIQESEGCDIFSGEWVPNPEAPYYTNTTCLEIQDHQNCMRFGRPDTEFMKWGWKPDRCELAVFDPAMFLQLVRGKSIAFVGDSVARNHMQSLMCLLSRVENPIDVSDAPEPQTRRFEYRNYNFTIAIFWSPYLVRATKTDPTDSTRPFNLFLDEFDQEWTTQIEDFNYVIISAGHWFFRPSMLYINGRFFGCQYCTQTNITHLTKNFSYRRAFRTAFRAINTLKNYKGLTILRSFAPSHFEEGIWNKGGNCVRTRPFTRDEMSLDGDNMELYMIQVEELRNAARRGRKRGNKFRLLDVTKAMLLRPDGHPSKYGHMPKANVSLYNDCVHWCLPGPIDTWNDFLIHMLQKENI